MLTNYSFVWTQPEEFNYREYILADGLQLGWRDILKVFDWQTFEFTPRTTRPLSSLIEIVDTKLRVWLWQFVLPHPSFSITWGLLLFVNPFLLYKLLRGLGIGKALSVMVASLYLTHPATLSLLAVNFRPAKPVANSAILLCLVLASSCNQLSRSARSSNVGSSRQAVLFGSLCLILLTSLFFDETAFLSFIAVPLLFPRIFFPRIGRTLLYGSIPLVAFACYLKLFPILAQRAGYSGEGLDRYAEITRITGDPVVTGLTQLSEGNHHSLADLAAPISRFVSTLWRNVGGDFPTNVVIFFSDTLGLVSPYLPKSWLYLPLWSGTLLLALWAVITMMVQRRRGEWGSGSLMASDVYSVETASAVLLVVVTLCANVLLHVVGNHVWGLHWLSTFWAIFFYLFAALWLNRAKMRLPIVGLLSIFIMSASFYNFIHVNNAFKMFFYYRTVEMSEVWNHKTNRFTVPFSSAATNYRLTRLIWESHENRDSIQGIPAELYYLVHDLRLVPPGTTYPKTYGNFSDGHIATFTLERSTGIARKYFGTIPEN
ncbi:MAG: hypothetical protein HYT87_13320 [Nitrospirae bacterium]|nr:hypothetical protein [Nitrospirota bacterium]